MAALCNILENFNTSFWTKSDMNLSYFPHPTTSKHLLLLPTVRLYGTVERVRGFNMHRASDCHKFLPFPNNETNPHSPLFHSQKEHQALGRTEGLESVTFLPDGVLWTHFSWQVSGFEAQPICNEAFWCSLLESAPKT